MKTKIYTLLKTPFAIDEEKWIKIWNTILEKYKESNKDKVILDFSEIRVVISPFMASLLKPLYDNKVPFEGANFTDEANKDTYQKVLEKFEKLWTINNRDTNFQ